MDRCRTQYMQVCDATNPQLAVVVFVFVFTCRLAEWLLSKEVAREKVRLKPVGRCSWQ